MAMAGLMMQQQQQRALRECRSICRPFTGPSYTAHRVQHIPHNMRSRTVPVQPSLARLLHRSAALWACAAVSPTSGAAAPVTPADLPHGSVSVVLLAGGVGKRMGAAIPKQYLDLKGRPIATYSLDTFARMPEVGEVVIVCDPSWRHVFEARLPGLPKHVAVKWALPGAERQDSVCNGLSQVREEAAVVAVHDSARPLVMPSDARRCMRDGWDVGAAVLGVPVKPTIKEVDAALTVTRTLQRSKLWEVQTPQCIRPGLLRQGFALVAEQGLEVTDDVSIVEAMGLPVRITPGSYTNIKVTTPDDMSVAEGFLQQQAAAAAMTVVAAASTAASAVGAMASSKEATAAAPAA